MNKWEKEAEKDCIIDKYNLDEIARKHPSIVLKWKRRKSKVRIELNNKIDQYETLKNSLTHDINNRSKKLRTALYGKDNLTIKAIESIVNNNSDIKKLREEISLLKNKDLELSGILDALKDKGFMIKGMIDLYVADYFDLSRKNRTSIKGRKQ